MQTGLNNWPGICCNAPWKIIWHIWYTVFNVYTIYTHRIPHLKFWLQHSWIGHLQLLSILSPKWSIFGRVSPTLRMSCLLKGIQYPTFLKHKKHAHAPCSMYGKFIVGIWIMFRAKCYTVASFPVPWSITDWFGGQLTQMRPVNLNTVWTWRTNPIPTNVIISW